MRFTVRKEILSWGSNFASKIVTSKTNLPVLGNILLTASENNFLQIESSNLELSIRLKIPAKVEEVGQVTIPARKFSEYINIVKEEKLEIRTDKNQLLVEGENLKTAFVTMPAADFPSLPSKKESLSGIQLEAHHFREIIKRTIFAASSRTDQPVLTGILFDFLPNGKVVTVSSDSFRLSYVVGKSPADIVQSVVVPATTLNEVDRLLADEILLMKEDKSRHDLLKINFSVNDNQIFFELGDVEIISRLLEASFPDYKKIIPSQFNTVVVVDRNAFVEAIKTTSIFSSREGQLVRMNIDADASRIVLSAQSSEVGSHNSELGAKIEGASLQVGFNSRYLLEGISSFSSTSVKLNMGAATGAVLIEADEKEKDLFSYQHIIMPMDLENI